MSTKDFTNYCQRCLKEGECTRIVPCSTTHIVKFLAIMKHFRATEARMQAVLRRNYRTTPEQEKELFERLEKYLHG